MVVVDQITNYAHFFSLSHPFKISIVVVAFMETTKKLHGNPKVIGSDKDSIFNGSFCIDLCSCLGT
jgi:hypothetical protein